MSVNASDESGPMRDRDQVPADTGTVRAAALQRAIRKSALRRERADRLAIERGEDDGMTVRAR